MDHHEETNEPIEQAAPPGSQAPKSSPWRRIQAAVLVLVALAAGAFAYWFYFVRGIVYSDDARVDANLVDVAPQIGGKLTELRVHEGESVRQGQVLYVLDKTARQAALERAAADVTGAQARLDIAKAEYDKALHGPRAAEIRIALAANQSAEAEAQLATSDWERAKALFDKNVLTDADRQKAMTAWERATHAQQEAVNRLHLVQQGTRSEDILAAKANVARAEADLAAARAANAQAQVNLDDTDVAAPFAGIVVRKWRDPGSTVAPGTPVVTLLNPATLHVAANIEEKDLHNVAVGDQVSIAVDAYPGTSLTGRVTQILRATNSQFGMIPSEGVSGTFIKVTQRVPLRIALEEPPPDLELSPGLSVEVSIRVRSGAPAPPPATEVSGE
jgi:membrane fusion protein (multidrug efflux system)